MSRFEARITLASADRVAALEAENQRLHDRIDALREGDCPGQGQIPLRFRPRAPGAIDRVDRNPAVRLHRVLSTSFSR